jgi:hypothetical protein
MHVPTCIAVLGHGEATSVDWSTRLRVERAMMRAQELLVSGSPAAAILFMAGVGCRESARTLAFRMYLYATECAARAGVPLDSLKFVYNEHEENVWGTLEEMLWAVDAIRRRFDSYHVEYVTNERHGVRVMRTARILGHSPPRIVTSDDDPSPRLHEALANVKLFAYRMGVYRPLQAFRRSFYSGG